MAHRAGSVADGRRPRRMRGPVVAVLAVIAYLGLAAVGYRTLQVRWQSARFEQRGVAFGSRALVSGTGVDPWGINVTLEQYPDEQALSESLDMLVAGGFRWVRQRFPWDEIEPARGRYDWEPWDAIVRQCQAQGLQIIAVLDGAPEWARAPHDAGNPMAPPRNPADLATFARAFALRYGPAIDHYQIWDQPNLYPHWGESDVGPAAYLGLLRAARTQIRHVDPDAVLVAAALAPTTEAGGRNLSEILFLRGLYEAGGRDLFDVVAAKPYGFWSGPEDRHVEPGVLNFSRLVAVHEEMVRWGDGHKPLWAAGWGWNALPADWQGQPSPWGSDEAWRQHERDLRALERARQEWPWLRLMCYAAWQPAASADDPVWGLALLDPGGAPGPLFHQLQALSQGPQVLYPGYHSLPVPGEGSGGLEIRFWGSRLDLVGPGRWEVAELDGQPLARALVAAGGQQVTAVRGLPAGEHRLVLRASEPAAVLQVVVARERPPWLPAGLAGGLLAAAALATYGLWRILRPYPWRRWFARGLEAYRRLSPWAALAVGAGGVALLAAAPGTALSLAALGLVALLIAGRPDVGLMLAVFLVPLAPLMKPFGPLRFSYLEVVTLLTVAVRAWSELRGTPAGLRRRLRGALGALNGLDLGFVLLLGACFLSLFVSEQLWVSLRELRVVILQAVFLYWLVSRGRLERGELLRLADLLVLSATVISLQGLHQYLWTERVIVAEGVRRMRGIYGSPNNLALVLGRLFPLMLAVAFAGGAGRRRWAYGLAAVPAAVCLFLTFSRGAWLLGVPASLLALALLMGRRARVAVAGLVLVGLLGVVPLLGTARFSSLFSLQGTSLLRVKLWEAAWEMACDHPWLGVGLDNFLYQYPRYIRPEALSEPDLSHPHNVVLDFWLRLGLPGLLAFGWLQWHFIRRALRLWRWAPDPALRGVVIGLLAGTAAMLAHGLIDAAFFVVELAALFALGLGVVRRLERLGADGRQG